jgi:hypothetical protein
MSRVPSGTLFFSYAEIAKQSLLNAGAIAPAFNAIAPAFNSFLPFFRYCLLVPAFLRAYNLT